LVMGVIVGGLFFVMKKVSEEDDDAGAALLAKKKDVDYKQVIQNMTQKMSDELAPQFEKGGGVRTALENRAETFETKAKNFFLAEMEGTAKAIKAELEKDEMGSMLEWNNAV